MPANCASILAYISACSVSIGARAARSSADRYMHLRNCTGKDRRFYISLFWSNAIAKLGVAPAYPRHCPRESNAEVSDTMYGDSASVPEVKYGPGPTCLSAA